MKIIHRYLLSVFAKNFLLSLTVLTLLFLMFDFFERLDNLIPEGASLVTILEYFALKVPLIMSLMLPIAMLVSIIFTIGMLSKNSEITAMRASGFTVFWITKPLYVAGIVLSLCSLCLNELVVPYATRRVKEIYNIDIQRKHERGVYNQSDFWWRSGKQFYSVGMFDSRDNTLLQLTRLDLNNKFVVEKRTYADKTRWLTPLLGWNMSQVSEIHFDGQRITEVKQHKSLPLPISAEPREFYDVKADPFTMSYRQLKKFIREQSRNGVSVSSYLPDLYQKLAFPLLIVLLIPAVLPFALRPARSGSLASSFIAGIVIAFIYYSVHSLSISLGRADLWHPLMAAWMANVILATVGFVLSLGAEAP